MLRENSHLHRTFPRVCDEREKTFTNQTFQNVLPLIFLRRLPSFSLLRSFIHFFLPSVASSFLHSFIVTHFFSFLSFLFSLLPSVIPNLPPLPSSIVSSFHCYFLPFHYSSFASFLPPCLISFLPSFLSPFASQLSLSAIRSVISLFLPRFLYFPIHYLFYFVFLIFIFFIFSSLFCLLIFFPPSLSFIPSLIPLFLRLVSFFSPLSPSSLIFL